MLNVCLVRLALRCLRVQLRCLRAGAPLTGGAAVLEWVAGAHQPAGLGTVLDRCTAADAQKLVRMAAEAMEWVMDTSGAAATL